MPVYHVGGIEFYDEETAKAAKRELQYIEYLKSRHNFKDNMVVKQLYQQFIAQGTFKTKVGEQFLNSLMDMVHLNSSNNLEIDQPLAKYCPNCGKEIQENAGTCLYCGSRVTGDILSADDEENIIANVFCFLIPIVGLILFMLYYDESRPNVAKIYGSSALCGFFIVLFQLFVYVALMV